MKPDLEMTFGEHLEELRRRVIAAVVGVVVASAACGIFYEPLLDAFLRPFVKVAAQIQAQQEAASQETPSPAASEPAPSPAANPAAPTAGAESDVAQLRQEVTALREEVAQLRARIEGRTSRAPAAKGDNPLASFAQGLPPRILLGSPLRGYLTILTLCIIGGLLLSSPWVAYQLWGFIGVGLREHERRFVRIFGPTSFVLFLAGAALFYFILLPLGLGALMGPTASLLVLGFPVLDSSLLLEDYFQFVAWMTLICGLIFQTPLVVLFLARTRIVPLETMARQQRLVILVMVILGAVLTPTGDPFSLAMMTVPLIVLYELGLGLAWMAQRKERREHPERFEPYDDLKDA